MTNDPFATAMKLLEADRPGREDVHRAIEMLEATSVDGHAGASERCALFEAVGIVRPQDWVRALDYLELAAIQGSVGAGEQLLLLADNSVDPAVPDGADADFWRAARARISIDRRIEPGEKQSLSDAPRIRLVKRFATGPECRWIVAGARSRLAPATVFDKESGGQTENESRDNSSFVLRLPEMSLLTEVIRHRISAAANLPVPVFEPAQVLHYAVGQRFKQHYDFLDPANPAYADSLRQFGQRIATFLIYLNDGYEGGETAFPAIGINYRAEEGDALFFANVTRDGAPDRQTLHAGMPPSSGEKWVFSQWIRDQYPKI
jgi:prolyl 4-hydroxylase